MPAIVKRKLLTEKGHLTIPKSYRDYYDLKKGDDILLLYDSIILIIPEELKKFVETKKKQIDKLLTIH
ncbi:MAG: hypothetical protein ACQXXH_02625 [Candidatus Bathyarchaeia archaeon]|jgi:bifunctional DNA-binding transcriptional regulator/antitoxin component of YhaV-PrlF toxin-antitoxin module|nr:hypothetical protein [Candidatus Bathyarchaeota archaeon A05DMB-4]MDH7594639.1 hypothetical protein [Candidatus Bathyarchaeota archaeon]